MGFASRHTFSVRIRYADAGPWVQVGTATLSEAESAISNCREAAKSQPPGSIVQAIRSDGVILLAFHDGREAPRG